MDYYYDYYIYRWFSWKPISYLDVLILQIRDFHSFSVDINWIITKCGTTVISYSAVIITLSLSWIMICTEISDWLVLFYNVWTGMKSTCPTFPNSACLFIYLTNTQRNKWNTGYNYITNNSVAGGYSLS